MGTGAFIFACGLMVGGSIVYYLYPLISTKETKQAEERKDPYEKYRTNDGLLSRKVNKER